MKVENMMNILPSEVNISNYNADLESQEIRVDSEILRPVAMSNTGTNDYVKFVISNKGILSPKSRIQFCGTTTGTYAGNTCFYPALVGGLSICKTARLQIGNRTIATSQNFNSFLSTQRGLVKPCKRLGVDAVEKLTNDTYSSVASYSSGVQTDVVTKCDAIGFYTGEVDNTSAVKDDVVFNDFSRIGSTASGSPTFSVSLEELFPFLTDSMDLPLFMFRPNEQVVIHLELQNDTQLGSRSVRDEGNSQFGTTLLYEPDVKMIVDYLYFSQNRMEMIENAFRTNSMITEYVDPQLVETSLDDLVASTGKTEKIILTGTNRVCRGIFALYQKDYGDNTSKSGKTSVVGDYFSEIPDVKRGFNLTINNQQLFTTTPSDMKTSENYYYYSTWNGDAPAYIPKGFYDYAGQITDNKVNGIVEKDYLRGKNSPFGVSFGNNGYNINSVPLQMTLYREDTSACEKCRLMVWTLVRRVFSVNQDGSVSVSF